MARVYHGSVQLCFNGGVFHGGGGGGKVRVDVSVDINWLPNGIGATWVETPHPLEVGREASPTTDPHPPQEPVFRPLGVAKYASNLSRKRNNPIEHKWAAPSLRPSINQDGTGKRGRGVHRWDSSKRVFRWLLLILNGDAIDFHIILRIITLNYIQRVIKVKER